MMDDLLPDLDSDAAKAVADSLKQRGVHVRTGTTVDQMTADQEAVTTDLSSGQRVITHAALLAVGRRANIDGIGLEDLGVKTANGVISVDAHCRTNLPGLYAIGDAASMKQYAHVASRMGLIAADNATGHNAGDDLAVVPECVYTHPEIASVGLSEADAKEQFDDVHVVRFPLRASGLAQAYGETEGVTKLIARQGDGRVLGAVVIAPRATDVIAEVALAIRHGLTVGQLAETIHAHPTFGETIHEAAEAWLGLPIHILRAR
jgi:dihydrolipoamide dehydrogenase